MNADHCDNADALAGLHAIAIRGPAPWTGEPAAAAKREIEPEHIRWAVLVTSRRPQLFKTLTLRRGVLALKAAFNDGSLMKRGPQYDLSVKDVRGEQWRLCSTYEDAERILEEH